MNAVGVIGLLPEKMAKAGLKNVRKDRLQKNSHGRFIGKVYIYHTNIVIHGRTDTSNGES